MRPLPASPAVGDCGVRLRVELGEEDSEEALLSPSFRPSPLQRGEEEVESNHRRRAVGLVDTGAHRLQLSLVTARQPRAEGTRPSAAKAVPSSRASAASVDSASSASALPSSPAAAYDAFRRCVVESGGPSIGRIKAEWEHSHGAHIQGEGAEHTQQRHRRFHPLSSCPPSTSPSLPAVPFARVVGWLGRLVAEGVLVRGGRGFALSEAARLGSVSRMGPLDEEGRQPQPQRDMEGDEAEEEEVGEGREVDGVDEEGVEDAEVQSFFQSISERLSALRDSALEVEEGPSLSSAAVQASAQFALDYEQETMADMDADMEEDS